MNKDKWDQYFMSMAYLIAMKSEDPRTKVGSVAVTQDHRILATGYNGLPSGVVHDDSRLMKPEKYMWVEHSERNLIYSAARNGISLENSILYCPWFSCTDCARAIIQSGIKEVVMNQYLNTDNTSSEWIKNTIVSRQMYDDVKLTYRWYQGPLFTELFSVFDGHKIPL